MSTGYKPRLCEVLGVDVEESFQVKGFPGKKMCIAENGTVLCDEVQYGPMLLRAINNPDCIERIDILDRAPEILEALKLTEDMMIEQGCPMGARNLRNARSLIFALRREIDRVTVEKEKISNVKPDAHRECY